MRARDGFSLTEVLVSLLLVTSASLSLMKQQWQVSRYVHQMSVRSQTLIETDNQNEHIAKI